MGFNPFCKVFNSIRTLLSTLHRRNYYDVGYCSANEVQPMREGHIRIVQCCFRSKQEKGKSENIVQIPSLSPTHGAWLMLVC